MDNNFNNQTGYNIQPEPIDFQGYPPQPDMNGYGNYGNEYNADSYDNGYVGEGYDNSYGNGYNDSGYDNGYDNDYDNGNGYDDGYGYGYNDSYDYDYNYMPKRNTGLIVALTVCIVAFISVATILIVVFVKEKNKKDSQDSGESTVAITTTASTAATTESATTQATTAMTTEAATTEAAAPTPFAVEHGFTWNSPYTSLQFPIYTRAFYNDGTMLTDDKITFDDLQGTYTFSDITKSAPDANGNVTISVAYTISEPIRCAIKTDITEKYNVYPFSRIFAYSDYYTGTQIDYGYDYANNCWATDYHYTDISYNNKTIRIGVLATMNDVHNDLKNTDVSEVGDIYETTDERRITIKFLVPADYDGLVLSIPKEGYTEAWKNAPSQADGTQTYFILGPDECGWTYTPDQLYFIRANDYIR